MIIHRLVSLYFKNVHEKRTGPHNVNKDDFGPPRSIRYRERQNQRWRYRASKRTTSKLRKKNMFDIAGVDITACKYIDFFLS